MVVEEAAEEAVVEVATAAAAAEVTVVVVGVTIMIIMKKIVEELGVMIMTGEMVTVMAGNDQVAEEVEGAGAAHVADGAAEEAETEMVAVSEGNVTMMIVVSEENATAIMVCIILLSSKIFLQ